MSCNYNCEYSCEECDVPDKVIEFVKGYNQALDDVWKKAISKYDECLDLGELREIVEELKR